MHVCNPNTPGAQAEELVQGDIQDRELVASESGLYETLFKEKRCGTTVQRKPSMEAPDPERERQEPLQFERPAWATEQKPCHKTKRPYNIPGDTG